MIGRPAKDMTGKRFSALTVVERAPNRPSSSDAQWLCKCQCGKEKIVAGSNLRSGNTRSCGCRQGQLKHGMSHTPTYRAWNHIVRTYGDNKTSPMVYDRWLDFEAFLEDMGERPEGMCLARLDLNDDYRPNNCKWMPFGKARRRQVEHAREQAGYRTAIKTPKGKMPMTEAAKVFGLPLTTLKARVQRGWEPKYWFKPRYFHRSSATRAA